MLGDLHLLDGLSQRRTIARAVLAGDSDLLRALRLQTSERYFVVKPIKN